MKSFRRNKKSQNLKAWEVGPHGQSPWPPVRRPERGGAESRDEPEAKGPPARGRRWRPGVVAVSGGFDPLHIGHLSLLKAAKALGNYLIVILNNDHWLLAKKGYIFMPQKERAAVLRAIRYVDKVIPTTHPEKTKDMSVSRELKKLKPEIFANGGDKLAHNIPEYDLCKRLGIKMVFNVGGGKAQSSSELVKKVRREVSSSQR